MLFYTVKLNKNFSNATLTAFVHESASQARPAVIVCPGGGYGGLSDREAEPIAEYYYKAGMNAYVLRYSVAPDAHSSRPLIEAATAIKYVREKAKEHNTAPEKIIICGFSAGGHLAASSGILWDAPEVKEALGIDKNPELEGVNRPNGMILSYPVITMGEYTHKGSAENLAGTPDYDEAHVEKFSLERHVDKTTPPMFIWHTVTDSAVNVRNSIMLVNAYVENGLDFEAHIYPYGPHGLSLANTKTFEGNPDYINFHVATWIDLSVMWIKDVFA